MENKPTEWIAVLLGWIEPKSTFNGTRANVGCYGIFPGEELDKGLLQAEAYAATRPDHMKMVRTFVYPKEEVIVNGEEICKEIRKQIRDEYLESGGVYEMSDSSYDEETTVVPCPENFVGTAGLEPIIDKGDIPPEPEI